MKLHNISNNSYNSFHNSSKISNRKNEIRNSNLNNSNLSNKNSNTENKNYNSQTNKQLIDLLYEQKQKELGKEE